MIYKKGDSRDRLVSILLDNLAEFSKKHPGKTPYRLKFSPGHAQLMDHYELFCGNGDPSNLFVDHLFSGGTFRIESILRLLETYVPRRYTKLEVDSELVRSVEFFER